MLLTTIRDVESDTFHVVATTTTSPEKVASRRSTISLKIMMAITGLFFVAFVLLHMYGNLKMFGGQAAMDEYAAHLRTIGEPILPYGGALWILRVLLVAAVVGHVYAAVTLWKRSHSARPKKYVMFKTVAQTLGAKTMRWGGLAILLFVIFHLLHFTTKTIQPGGSVDSLYVEYVTSFRIWWVVLIYALAMIALALHISHGAFSAMQTMGWTQNHKAYLRAKGFGHFMATVIVVGFILPPLAVLFGIIK